ncbi:MAG: hypothetical protein Q9O24_02340 [Gammaproteobacteria bacterium]|nr:hypothetical protein [Gammaproteobacteria bacterium]
MGFLSTLKKWFGMSKNNKADNEKELDMSECKNSLNLDYEGVQKAFNKIKSKSNKDFSGLEDALSELEGKFNNLAENKKQEELNGVKFTQLSKDLGDLKSKNNDLGRAGVMKIMHRMEEQRILSEHEQLLKEIECIKYTLTELAEDGGKAKYQENFLRKISNFMSEIDKKIKGIDYFASSKDVHEIYNKIKGFERDSDASSKRLANKINGIKIPEPQKIPNDYLKKDDFELTINEKLKDIKDIKESSESLDVVPAKLNRIDDDLKKLSEKMDNLPSSNGFQSQKNIPKEEKSIVDLAKYMTDGIAQFENIAKVYLSKVDELEKVDKRKNEHEEALKREKEAGLKVGEDKGKIDLIKKIYDDFPKKFEEIKSSFDDQLKERFEKGEVLDINGENINEYRALINDSIEGGKYKVISPAIVFLGGDVLLKANVVKKAAAKKAAAKKGTDKKIDGKKGD